MRSAALALAMLAPAPAAATAAEKAIWGPTALAPGRSAFPLYEDLGVDTLQMQLRWDAVAPQRPLDAADPADPAYVWPAAIDAAVAEAAHHRIRVALLINGVPPWANGGRGRTWAPADPRDFGRFAGAAARRYPQVRRWMIWGEPNLALRFQPNPPGDPTAARTYARMLDAAYRSLKSVSSANIVIGGMTWSGGDQRPSEFLHDMKLPNGRAPRLDWFGHNPFPFRHPDLRNAPVEGYRDISDLDTFGAEVDAAYKGVRRAPVPLWLSEFSVQSDHASSAFAIFVSRAVQATWLKAGFRIADRLRKGVAGIGWFALLDQPASPTSANWGLLTSDLAPKPAYAAFRKAPSRRHAARVRTARSVRLRKLRTRGLAVSLRLRSAGRHSVQLRRGGRIARLVRTSRSRTLRLRWGRAGRGRYTVRIVSPRGETRERQVRVR